MWWFASNDEGRFNIPSPDGTCYLANDPVVALKERLAAAISGGYIDMDAYVEQTEAGVEVSLVEMPETKMADMCHPKADKVDGITREISTYTEKGYPKTRAWAEHFHAEGFDGVTYAPRHSTGSDDRSYALFGQNTQTGRPAPHKTMTFDEVLAEGEITIKAIPSAASLEFETPPE